MAKIIVTIKGGKATVRSTGYSGPVCLQKTAAVQKALGQTTADTPTAEFHETGPTTTDVEAES